MSIFDVDMSPEERWRQAVQRSQALEGQSVPLEAPPVPRVSFLDHAAPYLAQGLRSFGPARLPGAGHTAANIASVLAQGFLGGRASSAERMFEDYDRRRREALLKQERGQGRLEAERRDARMDVREAASALSRHRYDTVVLPPELEKFAPGFKGGERVQRPIYEAAVKASQDTPEKRQAQIASDTETRIRTEAKTRRALGLPDPGTMASRFPSAAERADLVGDIGLLDQVGRVRAAFNPDFVGLGRGVLGEYRQRIGAMDKKESGFRGSLAAIRNQILRLRSGGAVTDGEAARLLQELPTLDNPPDAFNAKLDEFEKTFRTLAQSRREVLSGTGVDLSRIPALPGGGGQQGWFQQNAPGVKK